MLISHGPGVTSLMELMFKIFPFLRHILSPVQLNSTPSLSNWPP